MIINPAGLDGRPVYGVASLSKGLLWCTGALLHWHCSCLLVAQTRQKLKGDWWRAVQHSQECSARTLQVWCQCVWAPKPTHIRVRLEEIKHTLHAPVSTNTTSFPMLASNSSIPYVLLCQQIPLHFQFPMLASNSSIPYVLLCQQIPLHFQCLHPINVFSSPFALVLSALLRRSSETLISRLPVSWWVQSSLKCLAEQQKCISTTLRLDYHFYLV